MLHLQRANALHNAQSSLNWAPVTQRFLLTYPALPDFHNYATRFQSVTFRNLALGSKCCLSVCDSYHTDVLGLLHFCTGMTSGVKKKIWNSSTLFTADIKCAIKHTAQTLMAAWSPPREQRMYLERSSFFFSLVSPRVPRFPWVDVCGGQCVYLCACLRSEMMCEQEPCDRFAGCQSLEAFPLGCVQNKINIQYLAALVTETWAPHTH